MSLSLNELLRLVTEETEKDFDQDLSDDEEALVGDYVGDSGEPVLFTSTGVEGSRGLPLVDPCERDSLLFLDESLVQVSLHAS